jgi:hypothetical protein
MLHSSTGFHQEHASPIASEPCQLKHEGAPYGGVVLQIYDVSNLMCHNLCLPVRIMGSINFLCKLVLPFDTLYVSSANVEHGCARMECHFLQAKLKLQPFRIYCHTYTQTILLFITSVASQQYSVPLQCINLITFIII